MRMRILSKKFLQGAGLRNENFSGWRGRGVRDGRMPNSQLHKLIELLIKSAYGSNTCIVGIINSSRK